MNEELDKEIQNALMPAPMDDKLTRRLRTLAHEAPTYARPYWTRYLAPVSAAGAAALLVGILTLTPAKAEAKSFDLLVQAAQSVNAFQFSIVSTEDEKRETFSIAGADGRVFMRTGEAAVMEFDHGAMTIYDPNERKAMRFKFGGMVDAETIAKEMQSGIAEGMKQMDLRKMLQEYRQKYGEAGVRISGVSGGVYHVTLASKDEPSRVDLTVDAKTDLPEHIQVEDKDRNGRWHVAATIRMRFGSRVDASLLRSSIPAGVQVEEMDFGKILGDAMKGVEGMGADLEKMGEKFERMGEKLGPKPR